jgi:hypothetical protein
VEFFFLCVLEVIKVSEQLKQLESELQQAKNEHFLQSRVVDNLPEVKSLYKAKRKVQFLQEKFNKLQEQVDLERLERIKKQLIEKGFECRSGHTTSSPADSEWVSYDGAPWTFVVVPSTYPQITHISEKDCSADILTNNGETFINNTLGHGQTESEAWADAVDTWIS